MMAQGMDPIWVFRFAFLNFGKIFGFRVFGQAEQVDNFVGQTIIEGLKLRAWLALGSFPLHQRQLLKKNMLERLARIDTNRAY